MRILLTFFHGKESLQPWILTRSRTLSIKCSSQVSSHQPKENLKLWVEGIELRSVRTIGGLGEEGDDWDVDTAITLYLGNHYGLQSYIYDSRCQTISRLAWRSKLGGCHLLIPHFIAREAVTWINIDFGFLTSTQSSRFPILFQSFLIWTCIKTPPVYTPLNPRS